MLLSEHSSSSIDRESGPVADCALLSGLSASVQRRDLGVASGLLWLLSYHRQGPQQRSLDLLGLSTSRSGVSDHPVLRAVSTALTQTRGLHEVPRDRSDDAGTSASDGRRLSPNRGAGVLDEPAWEAAAIPTGGRPRETLRDCTPSTGSSGEDTVRPSWRHEEGGRNDHPAGRRLT